MNAPRLLLALALVASAVTFAPSATALDEPVCNDRDCLVSVETYVCVTYPCDGIVVCLARGAVCSNDRVLP